MVYFIFLFLFFFFNVHYHPQVELDSCTHTLKGFIPLQLTDSEKWKDVWIWIQNLYVFCVPLTWQQVCPLKEKCKVCFKRKKNGWRNSFCLHLSWASSKLRTIPSSLLPLLLVAAHCESLHLKCSPSHVIMTPFLFFCQEISRLNKWEGISSMKCSQFWRSCLKKQNKERDWSCCEGHTSRITVATYCFSSNK